MTSQLCRGLVAATIGRATNWSWTKTRSGTTESRRVHRVPVSSSIDDCRHRAEFPDRWGIYDRGAYAPRLQAQHALELPHLEEGPVPGPVLETIRAHLYQLRCPTRYAFQNGTVICIHREPEKTPASFVRFSKNDGQTYLELHKKFRVKTRELISQLLYNRPLPPHELINHIKVSWARIPKLRSEGPLGGGVQQVRRRARPLHFQGLLTRLHVT